MSLSPVPATAEEWSESIRFGAAEFARRQEMVAHLPVHFDGTDGVYYQPAGQSRVYIVEYAGVVKVGHSDDFETRLRAHGRSVRAKDRKLIRFWHLRTFEPLKDECVLLDLAHKLGGVTMLGSREWFTGIDALELIRRAEAVLVFPPH